MCGFGVPAFFTSRRTYRTTLREDTVVVVSLAVMETVALGRVRVRTITILLSVTTPPSTLTVTAGSVGLRVDRRADRVE